MRKKIFLIAVLLALWPVYSSAVEWVQFGEEVEKSVSVEVLESNDARTVVEIICPGMWVEDRMIDGKVYQVLILPGAGILTEVGKPQLPAVYRIVAIPSDKNVVVRVLDEEHILLSGYCIYPAQAPLPDLEGEGEFIVDKRFYSKDEFYPETLATFSGPGIWRDYRILQLAVSPIQFNPATGELIAYKKIKIELNYSGFSDVNIPKRPPAPTSTFEKLYKKFIINYDFISLKSSKGDGQYLIITADDFYNAVLPLTEWKEEQGIQVTLTKLSEIAPGDSTAIHTYIKDAYNTWAVPPEYVLLVGDTGILPVCHFKSWVTVWCSSVGQDTYYWECFGLIPNDHTYSLAAGTDYYSDVFIGRIPANTVAECEVMIDKIVRYEREPCFEDTSYYKMATGVGITQEGRIFTKTCRTIRNILLTYGYTWVDTLYEGSSPPGLATPANISSALNDGRTFLTYRGHGGVSGWYTDDNPPVYTIYTTNNVQGLNNGRLLPVVIAPTCQANNYEYSSRCMGEAFVNQDQGAVGYFGATNVSFSFWNDSLAIGIYRGIFEQDIKNFQAACDYGRQYMRTYFGSGDVTETEYYLMNILGDPELEMWTEVPQGEHGHITSNTTWSGDTFISGDVTVDAGVTLTINSGTNVIFAENYDEEASGYYSSKCELIVYGTLNAVGNGGNKITFRSTNTENPSNSDWGRICIESGGSATIKYCKITDAAGGVLNRSESHLYEIFTHNEMSNCGDGLTYYNDEYGEISNNTFTDVGIYCLATNLLQITDNTLVNADSAITLRSINALTTVSGNTINGNYHTGILVIDCIPKADIHHNVIYNSSGPGIKITNSQLRVVNNTIDSNEIGVELVNTTYPDTVKNNIVTNNSLYGIRRSGGQTPIITYNDVWFNGTNYEGCYAGEGCISENPLFQNASGGDYRLQSGSPCIDAGDPSSPLDPDNTRADMGALYYNQSGGCPYVFVWTGEEYIEDNTILGDSERGEGAGSDVTDYYKLGQPLVEGNGRYLLQIREFEQEHSYFDQVKLLAIDHPGDVLIGLNLEGEIIPYRRIAPPTSCVDDSSRDCLPLINDVDDQYFHGLEGNWLVLEFEDRGKSQPWWETATARKKVTTIALQVQGERGWEDIALLHPRENWSTQLIDLSSVVVSGVEGLKFRLLWRSDHKLDYVGLAQPQPSDLTVQECPLKSAVHSQRGPVVKYLLSVDKKYVELIPDEQFDLSFSSLKPPPNGYERDFILVSTGYYTRDKTYTNLPKASSDHQIPASFSLSQNYPNPFNLKTEIEYALPKNSHVVLKIYNVQGQLVRTLVDEDQGPGFHKILWDGRDSVVKEVASGIYFYQIKAREFVQTKRMVLLK